MAANEIEVILSRQFADCLDIPVFLVKTNGDLVFYNGPAEELLGKRFEDTGPMPVEEWSVIFNQKDDDGNEIPPEELPLVKALNLKIPAHKSLWIENLSNKTNHHISVTAIPIIGQADRFLGALAIFWENKQS